MAKPGDKPKNLKKKEEDICQVKVWKDPNPDRYGFEKTIKKLQEKGFNSFKENGILIIQSEKNKYTEIEKIISHCNFLGSWCVRFYSKKEEN